MKSSRQQRTSSNTSSKCNTTPACNRKKTSRKRNGGQVGKATGKIDTCLSEKNKQRSSSSPAQALGSQLPAKGMSLRETEKYAPALKLEPGETLQTSSKIKLQLFPIDEGTRVGLEKDGHNPHLELSLSARKKISSVLKHLINKWGSSNIAIGELMLFPYSIQLENLAGYRRWTLNDSGTSTADVYAAIESPTVFRLRYGWFSNAEPKRFRVPLTCTRFEVCSQSENIKKDLCENVDTTNGEKQQIEVISQEYQPINSRNKPSALVGGPMPIAVEPMDDLRVDNGLTLSSTWADSFTDISIGGLLSEVSLQGKSSHCDRLPTGNNSGLQQVSFNSDSFDAAIAAHIHGFGQGPKPSSFGSHSSILDAEETCHAFPFQKFSSGSGKSTPGACYPDSSSKPFRFPNFAEGSAQAGTVNDRACQKSKVDLPPHSQGVGDSENSQGLSSINWCDYLGPLDLGLSSSSRQIIGEDSISLGSLLASSSLDAFQSSSFFVRDKKVTVESKI